MAQGGICGLLVGVGAIGVSECRYSGDRRVIGAFGCSCGVLGPLGDIRGVSGAQSVVTQGQKYRWHKGHLGVPEVLEMFGAIRECRRCIWGLAGSVWYSEARRGIGGIKGIWGLLGVLGMSGAIGG